MEHHESQGTDVAPAPEPGFGNIDPAELVHAAAALARENPHTALAGAFAVGFLLGGGLTPRVLLSLAALVGRRYGAEAAQEALAGVLRQQIDEVSAR